MDNYSNVGSFIKMENFWNAQRYSSQDELFVIDFLL